MLFSGASEKMTIKNLKQQISWHCPFKAILYVTTLTRVKFVAGYLNTALGKYSISVAHKKFFVLVSAVD